MDSVIQRLNNRGQSFRFWDQDVYKYEIFLILSIAHAWTNVILAGKQQVIKSISNFIILLSGEGLTSFSINTSTNFFDEKK